jgi:hypothetical protein
MEDKVKELLREIEAAFADVEYPGDDALVDGSYGEDPAAITAELRGETDWRRLSSERLDRVPGGRGTALAFFSDAAFRFYLPAYMTADVRGELSLAAPEVRLCWSLTPQSAGQKIAEVWGGGTVGERARRCFDALEPRQAAVVVEYLLWKLERLGYDDPAITQALDHYWLERSAEAETASRREDLDRFPDASG